MKGVKPATPGPTASPRTTRRQATLLLCLAVAALAWRLVAVSQKVLIETDGAHFGHLARLALASGWGAALDPAWPPLLPWLAALGARLLGSLAPSPGEALAVQQAGYLVSALAGAACVPLTWLLGRRWAGAPAAWGAALLLAAHPQAVRYSASMMSESLFACLWLATLLCLENGARATPSIARRALAGLCAALAILTRPEGWALAVVGGLDSLRAGTVRGRVERALAFLSPVALVGLPWLSFLHGELGGPSAGAKGPYNFHLAHGALYQALDIEVLHGDVKSLRAEGVAFRAGDYRVGDVLARAPGRVAGAAAGTLGRALFDKLPSLLGWYFVPLALLGLWRRASWPAGVGRVLGLLALWLLALAPFFVLQRFFLPFLPFLLLAVANGALELAQRALRASQRAAVLRASLALVLLLMAGDTLRGRREAQRAPLYLEAAAVLGRERTEHPVRLAGLKPEPAFYAEVPFHRVTSRDAGALRRELDERGATHLLLDDLHTPDRLPELVPWLAPGAAPEWLVPVIELSDERQRIRLWRIAPPDGQPSSERDP